MLVATEAASVVALATRVEEMLEVVTVAMAVGRATGKAERVGRVCKRQSSDQRDRSPKTRGNGKIELCVCCDDDDHDDSPH